MYELKHASEGKEKNDHKYIIRIPLKNKTKKRKYRYIYDLTEYKSYLKGQKNDTDSQKSDKKNNIKFKPKKLKNNIKTVKKFLDKMKNKTVEKLSNVETGVEFIDKVLDKFDDKTEHKYVERVKLPNGKYRYFYTQEEYDAYVKRQEYQKNEPDFMNNVPEIDLNVITTKDEDMAEINEKINKIGDKEVDDAWNKLNAKIQELTDEDGCYVVEDLYETDEYKEYMRLYNERMGRRGNCTYATTAYELRRRGYDVEAALNDDGANIFDIYEWYENPEMINISPTGETISLTPYVEMGEKKGMSEYLKKIESNKKTEYNPKMLEKTIVEYSGKNSRGNICVYWNGGGGHSMVYEVDSKGKVTIRDCQVNMIHSMETLTERAWDFSIMRTDNLELSKPILETVYDNRKEESLWKEKKQKK